MKTITIKAEQYNPQNGLKLSWDENVEIIIAIEDGTVKLQANTQGLRTMARHLLTLAEEEVPDRYHVHLDDSNGLDDGSVELTIEKNAMPRAT